MAAYGAIMTPAAGARSAGPYGQDAEKEKMVYVGNLPYSVKWQELKDHMGQAGTVEFAKILTEDGSEHGRSRGTGYVRYASEAEAQNAVAIMRESELAGRNLLVDLWTGSGKGAACGKGKGGGKGNAAAAALTAALGGIVIPGIGKITIPGANGAKGGGKGWKQPLNITGDPSQLVYIGNLAYSVTWQDLKQHMAQAGTVEFSKVLTEDGTDFGRSRGSGVVRFSTEAEALNAIATLPETELKGRKILVDHWSKKFS